MTPALHLGDSKKISLYLFVLSKLNAKKLNVDLDISQYSQYSGEIFCKKRTFPGAFKQVISFVSSYELLLTL